MPFLVQNVGLERLLTGGKMMAGTPEGMASEEGLVSMPAARALVRIGPDSSAALIDAYWKSMSARDRMVALSVIGRIGATGAREFLGHVMQEADWERSRAADALKRLDARAK
jgi:HEAT repeat protein